MKLTLEKFHPSHAQEIEYREWDRQVVDGLGAIGASFTAGLAQFPSLTIRDGLSQVVAFGGIVLLCPGAGEFWMRGSPLVERYPIGLARIIHRFVAVTIERDGYRRVQATIRADYAKAIALVEWLGFQREGLMRKYGADGQDYFMYGRVA